MFHGSKARGLILGPALLLACGACGPTAADRALEAYGQARFEEAWELFAEAEDGVGPRAPATLLFDRALAELGAGRLEEAERDAERAAARGGTGWYGVRDFLRGNAAFERSRRAAAEAALPEAPPFTLERAADAAREAAEWWARAAWRLPDRAGGAAARRNVERALRAVETLEQRRAETEARRRKAARPRPRPRPLPVVKGPPAEEGPGRSIRETEVEAVKQALAPEAVEGILEKLAQKEKEKLAVRRARRRGRGEGVEKDW